MSRPSENKSLKVREIVLQVIKKERERARHGSNNNMKGDLLEIDTNQLQDHTKIGALVYAEI